jgi:hypothetical protein
MKNQGARTTLIIVVLLLLTGCVIGGVTLCYDFGMMSFKHNRFVDHFENFEYTAGQITTQSGAIGGAIGFGLFAAGGLIGFVKVFLAWIR